MYKMHPELHDAATSLENRLEKLKEQELQELAEKFRKYPNGFKFYYSLIASEDPRVCQVSGVYLSRLYSPDVRIQYTCDILLSEPPVYIGRSEDAIDFAIEKFGIPS